MCQPSTASPPMTRAATPIPTIAALVRADVLAQDQQDEAEEDGADRHLRAPHEHEPVLFLAVGDPLPGREQSVGVAHAPCPSWRSGPRMGPAIDVPDPLPGQMRVQLGRGDTRMTEQLLDDPQVGAAFEQVRRERVPQRVRAHPAARGPPASPPRSRPPRPTAARAARRDPRGTAVRRGPATRDCGPGAPAAVPRARR